MFFSYHFKVLYWGQRIYLVSMVNHLHTLNPLISFTGWQNNSKPSVRPVRLIKLLCLKCECTIFSILYLNPPCVHSICSLLFFLVREIIFLVTIFGLSLLKMSHSVMSESLGPHGLYSPWNSPGQNTGVGSLSLLQGIFPTQESNWGLLHCRWILNQRSYEWSPIPLTHGKWLQSPNDFICSIYFLPVNISCICPESRIVNIWIMKRTVYSWTTNELKKKSKENF